MRTASPLFRRYIRILVICMGGLTCTAGIVHMIVLANAQWASLAALLDAQTRAASAQIVGYLDKTVASLQWIDDVDQPGVALDLGAVRDESHRLLRRTPSVIALSFFDAAGCERLYLARVQPDVTGTCPTAEGLAHQMFSVARGTGVSIGDIYFPDGSEPHLLIGVPSRGAATGALVAEINLKVIHDTIAAIHVGNSGLGFVVDRTGRLIAHTDETLVLRQAQLPSSAYIPFKDGAIHFATNFTGQWVVRTSRDIPGTQWFIVVEQPAREALGPMVAALITTGVLVLAALIGSLIAGLLVARRLTRPLSQLRDGAAQIGRGDLTTRMTVATGDEIEQVAQEFNRMAAALAESHSQLEAKVADRTAALQSTATMVQRQADELVTLNSALATSLDDAHLRKVEAERANAAKSRFLAVASHDLRQPMHAISLLVGLIHRSPSSNEQKEIIQKIQSSVEAMEDLFVNLLDVSKLDAGAVRPSRVDFPVRQVLLRARNSFGPMAEAKGLTLDIADSDAVVKTDPALLERIAFNLISNAIRYTPQGRVRVRVHIDGTLACMTVSDTGIGIPEEYRQRIFEEFFQINAVQSKGLGLGLSIVKQCAELLGHSISLESSSSGSSFRVQIPFVGLMGPQAGDAIRNGQVSARLSLAFVILLDDDADNRYAAEQTYRQWGCRTLSAQSDDEAKRLLAEHLRTPDLIVTDLHLQHGQTGLMIIERIRADSELCIPAIILSGEAGPVQPACLPDLCVLMQKPVGTERLKEASERLLLQFENRSSRLETSSV